MKQFWHSIVLFRWSAKMPSKNERVELEMKIIKARQWTRRVTDEFSKATPGPDSSTRKKLREIDE
jgi:hypothetical protein